METEMLFLIACPPTLHTMPLRDDLLHWWLLFSNVSAEWLMNTGARFPFFFCSCLNLKFLRVFRAAGFRWELLKCQLFRKLEAQMSKRWSFVLLMMSISFQYFTYLTLFLFLGCLVSSYMMEDRNGVCHVMEDTEVDAQNGHTRTQSQTSIKPKWSNGNICFFTRLYLVFRQDQHQLW